MRGRIHRSEFVRQLKLELPEADPYLDGMRDGLTLEMGGFATFAGEAIERGDYETVARCFRFADRLLERGNRAVRNAVAVVFLENLRFEGLNGWPSREPPIWAVSHCSRLFVRWVGLRHLSIGSEQVVSTLAEE